MGSVLSILSKAPSNQLEKVELMEGTWEAINNPLGFRLLGAILNSLIFTRRTLEISVEPQAKTIEILKKGFIRKELQSINLTDGGVQVGPDGSLITTKIDVKLGEIVETRKLINENQLQLTTAIIGSQTSSTQLYIRK